MNNIKDIKQKVNSKYGMLGYHHNTNETWGSLATAHIMFYLLEIIYCDTDSIYCDTDSIYLINKESECKYE